MNKSNKHVVNKALLFNNPGDKALKNITSVNFDYPGMEMLFIDHELPELALGSTDERGDAIMVCAKLQSRFKHCKSISDIIAELEEPVEAPTSGPV